ncbi:MAG TPA: lysyl oxidase family protein [Methylomirabilota bacterium]|nr:lysyl oxidase family protein [Methylomirabilota bacterium]
MKLVSAIVAPSAPPLLACMALILGDPVAGRAQTGPPPLPDLIIWNQSVAPVIEFDTFLAESCEVVEGCAVPGTRRLLRFNTETRNIGTGDLFLGDPKNSPLFRYASCHGHYHFNDFTEYRLRDSNGVVVALGGKAGFCLIDSFPIDPGANQQRRYNCDYQGIQAGWADVYSRDLACQWVDITGLPPGRYTLEMEVDPLNQIPESNETNNVIRIGVGIDIPCGEPPANDNHENAVEIPYASASYVVDTACATRQPDEPDHYGAGGSHSVWYRWVAPSSGPVTVTTAGSSFDTVLAAYRRATLGFVLVEEDDDGGESSTSRIVFVANAGTAYYFAIDGYANGSGRAVLNLNPGGNDAFSRCTMLMAEAGRVGAFSGTATRESGEPQHASQPGGRSVWFCWMPTQSGPVEISTAGSLFDTVLAVYTGASVNSLVPVVSDNDGLPDGQSRVTFPAVAGTPYRVAVDGIGGTGGVVILNWRPVLRLLPPIQVSSNAVKLTIGGAVGDRCVIDSSTNLADWTEFTRVSNATGRVELIVPTAAREFFRLRTE